MDEVGIKGYTIVEDAAPRRLSYHIIYNLTRLEHSTLLLAPFAREASGFGECKEEDSAIFPDTTDPAYQTLQ